jgi:medium-chain acyl-[acyl-carrier-protein] hydrolase
LYCFPHAGGSAAEYSRWSELLPAWIEVHPVQLPGRGSRIREQAYDSIGALVEAFVEQVNLDPPYALFGHSLGALVAFEIARRRLEVGAVPPVHLFVSGHHAPGRPSRLPAVSTLSDGEIIDNIHSRYGSIPDGVRQEPELLALLLPMLRADFTIAETYVPMGDRVLDDVPISVYGGRDDKVARADLLAWSDWTHAAFAMELFDGGHFYLREQAAGLTRSIATNLEVARTEI